MPFPWRDLDPHLIHGSLGPPESSTQTASRSVQLFFAGLTSVTDWQTTLKHSPIVKARLTDWDKWLVGNWLVGHTIWNEPNEQKFSGWPSPNFMKIYWHVCQNVCKSHEKISAKYSKYCLSYGCLNAANLGVCKLENLRIVMFFNFDSQ